jgi:DNA-binding beta-propeller fold protein YncE
MSRDARAQVYVANRHTDGSWVISKYTDRGCVINDNLVTLPSAPSGVAVSGDNLFVADPVAGTIGKYDADTGAVINASLITGLTRPVGLMVLGKSLFVANTDSVGKYDADTGAVIKANFIQDGGMRFLTGLAVSSNDLFVAHSDGVGRFSPDDGSGLSDFIRLSSPFGLAIYGLKLFVSKPNTGTIYEYGIDDPDHPQTFMSGLNFPTYLTLSGDDLYIADSGGGSVGAYNADNGDSIIYREDLIIGLHAPAGIAVK